MSTKALFRTVALLMAGLSVWQVSVAGQRRKPVPERIACVIEGATYFPFGYYDPFLPNDMDVQSQISYRCYQTDDVVLTSRLTKRPSVRASTPKTNVEISISRGTSGTYDRRMRGINDEVSYNLYLDSNRRTIWGDGTGGTSVFSKNTFADNVVQVIPIYGRMPAGQDARGAAYADILVITIDF
jgi:spore coat protein U-like protein